MMFHAGFHRALEGDLTLEADVAILGAGAGGSAAAMALAEAGLTVVVVEEGRKWDPRQFRSQSSWSLKHLYQQRGARVARGSTVMPLPGGRGVGGSTLVNSAICFRTPQPVLDRWREVDGLRFHTQERFDRYFERIWKVLGVTVQSEQIQRMNNVVFRDGAEKLGLRGEFLARSAPGCAGCGICQYGCPTGGKSSVDRTFLKDAVETGNVAVWSNCRVTGAEWSGTQMTAAYGQILDEETQGAVGTVRIRARSFVVAMGPIGSPIFLQANGLSSSDQVGRNLVVHPGVPALAMFPFEIKPWHGVTQGYYVDMWEDGFLLQTYSTTPDQYFAVLPTAVGLESMGVMSKLAFMGSAGPLVHDEDSVGGVANTPVGPDIQYYLGDGDRKRLLAGLRMCGDVFRAAGAHTFYPGVHGMGALSLDRDLAKVITDDIPAARLRTYASHPMGTCRMGADPTSSVLGPDGRVWEMENVYVADASTFPSSLGVNPQVTTMATGLMVGEQLGLTLQG